MTQDAMELIDALAQRFGTTASFLIEEMARYYIARTGTMFVAFTALTAAVVMFAVLFLKVKEKKDKDPECDEDTFGYIIGVIFCVFFAVVFGIIAIGSAVDLIGWIASPTAAVLEKIIGMLRVGS